MSIPAVPVPMESPRAPWYRRLPVVLHFNKSVGLQRGMLVAGLILTGLFVLTALFAPLLAPYGFSQLSDADGNFPTQQAPGGKHLLGTTVGGYDVLSRVIYGARLAFEVVLASTGFALVIGVPLGLV